MVFDFIKNKEYTFLKDKLDEGLIMLLGLGGSRAYGTEVEGSDTDLRGIMFNTKDDILLMREAPQLADSETDTVIYTFSKAFKMLCNTNPNVIEILGCRKEDYAYIHPLGQRLLDNADIFLSKQCVRSFGSYAYQQLSRLENALARDRVSQPKQEEHIVNSIRSAMLSMDERYRPFDGIELYVGDSDKKNLEAEIFINCDLKGYPLRDFNGIMQELLSIQRNYGKVNHRNRKKDDAHLNKHAMHLVRLYLMLDDILDGKIVTHREKDRDLLMAIRNGKYMLEDGTYDPSFFEMVAELKNKTENKTERSSLPENPDYERANSLLREVNEYVLQM